MTKEEIQKERQKKANAYADRLLDCMTETVNEIVNEEDSDPTALFHAMANITPCFIYSKLVNQVDDFIEFNHIANRLVFQFSTKDD